MRLRNIIVALVSGLCGMIVGATAPALATTVTSNYKTVGPYSTHYYLNRSVMWDTNGLPQAIVSIQTRGGDNVPIAWMGVKAISYRNSIQCNSTVWQFNQASAAYFQWSTGNYECGSGNYVGGGMTKAYRDSIKDYATDDALSTPVLTW